MTDSMFDRAFDDRTERGAQREAQTDSLHRMMTGQTLTRQELRYGGLFIAAWFLMDLVQWLDWLADKFR